MATINIGNLFENNQKRFAEALTVTVPAVLKAGGGRSQAQPTYIQGSDALIAGVIENNTLIKGAFVKIEEAFPAGALLNVDIAGTGYFVGVDAAANGAFYVSTEENNFLANPQTVTISIAGVTGDVTTGLAKVIFDTVSVDLKNGNYAE